MSSGTVDSTSVYYSGIRDTPREDRSGWRRNPSWLSVTPPSLNEQKITVLYAVMPDAPYAAFNLSGAYTVNWGDGLTENVTSGTTAVHTYNYNNALFDGTDAPVTFNASTSTVERTAHGYRNGEKVIFYSINSTTGISINVEYFVINSQTNSFQVSLTENGSAITLTNNGTGTLLPYKQAIITLTPQAGQNITTVYFNNTFLFSGITNSIYYTRNWMLEIFLSVPKCTVMYFCTGSNGTAMYYPLLEAITVVSPFESTVSAASDTFSSLPSLRYFNAENPLRMGIYGGSLLRENPQLREVKVNLSGVTSANAMFSNCYKLSSVSISGMSGITTTASMFQNCTSLETVPVLDTSSTLTDSNGMFNGCTSLKNVPVFTTSAVTNTSNMFFGCRSLVKAPAINISSSTNTAAMFEDCSSLEDVPAYTFKPSGNVSATTMFKNCRNLKEIPLMNTQGISLATSMFENCYSLWAVPELNMSSATGTTYMFAYCYALRDVGIKNTSACTNMSYMFIQCYSLEQAPSLDTSACTNMTSMFNNCKSLKRVPTYNTQNVTNITSMFDSCSALTYVPAFNFINMTTGGASAFTGTILTDIDVYNIKNPLSVASTRLSIARIEDMFNNLIPVNGNPTINVSNTPAVSDVLSRAGTTTSGSTIVTITNTTGFVVGMDVTGSSITSQVPVTITTGTNLITRTAHGIPNNTPINFTSIANQAVGLSTAAVYYVVNATADTFQLANTVGGTPLTITASTTGNITYPNTITAVSTNTNITLSIPASGSGASTMTVSTLKRYLGRLKGYTITT